MSGRQVLLVHGAWHGPWCWDEWSEALAEAGHSPRAIALPGHTDPGSSARIWNRLGQYVKTVRAELAFLGADTVIVGHSMGGLVTQRAIEKQTAALGVLMASVPLRGVWGATLRTGQAIPANFVATNAKLSMYEIVATPALTQRAFFGPSATDEIVRDSHSRLQNESYLAYLQMFGVLPRPKRVKIPVKVVAGSDDTIFSVEEERQLAAAYDTEAVVIDGAGHDLMLDPAGRPALDQLLAWIDELG